jgi:nanoRNase/pAp phosphatase (c-di-AMP/oligoRNAs hydrolase)
MIRRRRNLILTLICRTTPSILVAAFTGIRTSDRPGSSTVQRVPGTFHRKECFPSQRRRQQQRLYLASENTKENVTFGVGLVDPSSGEFDDDGAYNRVKTTQDGTYTARFLSDNGLQIQHDDDGRVTARPVAVGTTTTDVDSQSSTLPQNNTKNSLDNNSSSSKQTQQRRPVQHITEHPATVVPKTGGFNVVLTHCTADFDSLASAVGLAKLWSNGGDAMKSFEDDKSFDSASHVPTFVVLPRGAHPGVQRFLGLHKHLFPIRSLKSLLSSDYVSSLNRLALVDAQRRDRLGPAEPLLQHAKRITVVDHHIDQDSDIVATDYVVDQVGSVSTIIAERLKDASETNGLQLTEAEATLLALGIHADTGNLCFDSTTVRDAYALAWCRSQGASQAAIAEHAQSSLSSEQQGVLTQALVNANTTMVHGVTVSTVLLQADGFINGLATVTQDALELSSSDIFLLGLVYHAKSGSGSRKGKKGGLLTTQLLSKDSPSPTFTAGNNAMDEAALILYAEAWQGGEEALRRRRLRAAFDRTDTDGSGYLDEQEVAASLASSGVIALPDTATDLIKEIDADGNGKIDFEEFVVFATEAEKLQKERNNRMGRKGTTMIIIGRVKAGVNMKAVKLNKLLEQFGGGGHAKAASATVRLNDEAEAEGILQSLVDELIATNLQEQQTVGDFVSTADSSRTLL